MKRENFTNFLFHNVATVTKTRESNDISRKSFLMTTRFGIKIPSSGRDKHIPILRV